MKYHYLAANMPPLSAICFGAACVGLDISEQESFVLLDRFVELGGNFIDTAEVYSDWAPPIKSRSEKLLGRWMADRGVVDSVVVATKGGCPRLDSMSVSRLGPDDIRQDVENSLRNLRLERLELYYLHRDDPDRPVAQIMKTMAASVAEGKVGSTACSNWRADRIRAANEYARANGLPQFVLDQPRWSLAALSPDPKRDPTMVAMDAQLYEFHRLTGMAAAAYSSQAQGFFGLDPAGDFTTPLEPRVERLCHDYHSPLNMSRLKAARELAAEMGCTPTQVALAWLLRQPFKSFAIIGTTRIDRLEQACAAANLELSDPQFEELEAGEGKA